MTRRSALRGAERVWRDLRFRDLYRGGREFELMHRALGFAALATPTLIPLLVLVAAANPASHRGLAGWVIYGMDLTGSSADAVTHRGPPETAGRLAVATIVGLAGLRVFSYLVFEPLIIKNAVSYGALGTVLIVASWLIGVGWVLYGAQLFGRWSHDSWLRDWAARRRER